MDEPRTDNEKIIEQVRQLVNVTRGEYESLLSRVNILEAIVKDRKGVDIPNKNALLKEIARLLDINVHIEGEE